MATVSLHIDDLGLSGIEVKLTQANPFNILEISLGRDRLFLYGSYTQMMDLMTKIMLAIRPGGLLEENPGPSPIFTVGDDGHGRFVALGLGVEGEALGLENAPEGDPFAPAHSLVCPYCDRWKISGFPNRIGIEALHNHVETDHKQPGQAIPCPYCTFKVEAASSRVMALDKLRDHLVADHNDEEDVSGIIDGILNIIGELRC